LAKSSTAPQEDTAARHNINQPGAENDLLHENTGSYIRELEICEKQHQ
jgi:hypothetical protein